MYKNGASKISNNENNETESLDYDNIDMLPGGESTPYRDGVKPPGQGEDQGVGVVDKEDSNDGADAMRYEIDCLRNELSSLKLYCGNLEAEKYTLQDELSTFRYALDATRRQVETYDAKIKQNRRERNKMESMMQLRDVQKMLPTFDPDSKSGMDIDEWIEAVE